MILVSHNRHLIIHASNLISDLPGHVSLCSLQCSESLPEIELYVVSLAFHADSKEQPSLSIQVEPVFAGHIVTKMRRIELNGGAANTVMIP